MTSTRHLEPAEDDQRVYVRAATGGDAAAGMKDVMAVNPQQPGPQPGWPQPGSGSSWPQAPSGYLQPPYPDRGRNGFSIAGLVLGIIPVMGGLLGMIFGLIGRSQSKRRGQKGRVMGTIGALLGATWLTIIIVIAVNEAGNSAQRGNDGQVVKPGDESAFTLRVGDCLRSVPEDASNVNEVNLVSCARAHKGEVYKDIGLTEQDYPGTEAMSTEAEHMCTTAFKSFDGLDYNDSTLDVFFLYPTARSWSDGDRKVTCLITGEKLVGTMKGSRR